MKFIKGKLSTLKTWFVRLSLPKKLIVLTVLLFAVWLIRSKFFGHKTAAPQYQTADAQRGTLIVTTSGSGQVASANSASVSTDATGVVKNVFVKNGDTVRMGAKIADLELDQPGQQKNAAAYASYQSARNSLDTAKANLYSSQSDMLTQWKTYLDIAQSSTYQNSDGSPNTANRQLPEYVSTNDDWLASEAKYKVQQNTIAQAQTAQTSSWLTYLKSSPVIYAPISGKVSGLSLVPGAVLTDTSTGNQTSGGTKVASILTEAAPTISVNLTQIDVPKVAIGNQATVTLDAFPGKTYTGKVISIDITGSVSSGVTTYPTTIALDTSVPQMYPNMTASANIITLTKDNVLLVPTGAVQTQNGISTVRVLNNGQIEIRTVETGASSDSQTEITSGLNEGDTVVTSVIQSASSAQRSTSPFSGFGGGGGTFFRSGGPRIIRESGGGG